MNNNLLDHLPIWPSLAVAYAADPVRVALCWQAHVGGDIKPLTKVIADLGHTRPVVMEAASAEVPQT